VRDSSARSWRPSPTLPTRWTASAPTYRGPSGRRAGHAAQILRLGVYLRPSEAAERAAASGARSGNMHDRLLAHQDALAPRGRGRLTPRSSHSMPISLSEGRRGRRFAARVAEDVPSPDASSVTGRPTTSSTAAVTPRSRVPRLAGIRPSGRPHTKMGTARADTGSPPRNHARRGLRTQSRSRGMNAVGCRLSEFGLGTTDATACRVTQAPAVPRKGRHWNFGTSDIS
jgi:hypothetical protein